MTLIHAILLTVIVAELVSVSYLHTQTKSDVALPDVNFGSLEPSVAIEIREFQDSLDFQNPDSRVQLGEVYRAFGMLPESEYCYQRCKKTLADQSRLSITRAFSSFM